MNALHKVLVVDDDPVIGRSFNRVLSDKGYLVITAQNAQEALEKMRDAKYDVVYTDIRMPGMDGIELAEQLKAKHPWTPVVIITGYGTMTNEVRAKTAGVSAFLRKPLSPEAIEGSAAKAVLEAATTVVAQPEPAPVEEARPKAVAIGGNLKKIALFVAAPLITLGYVLFLPFIGLGILAAMGVRALAKMTGVRRALTFLKNVALFIVAPFVALAYVVMFPFVGAAMLAWFGVQALIKKRPAE